MEGPQVVVPEVHQVLQGRVKLVRDALEPQAAGKEGEDGEREREKGQWAEASHRASGAGSLPTQPQRGA